MLSPIERVLKGIGVSRQQLSLLADVHEGTISRVASGIAPAIPKSIRTALADLGVDVLALDVEYRRYRSQKVDELRARFVGRCKRDGIQAKIAGGTRIPKSRGDEGRT